jgi:hypothetical protein
MVLTQCELVKEAAREGAAIFFVGPDQIYNKGAFANHIARFQDGARVVIGPGVRIKRDAARPVLEAAIAASPDGSFSLDAETQTKLFFDQWHPINNQFLLNSSEGIPWKAYVYERPKPGELLIRFFQGPTLAAWPQGPIEGFDGFVDHNLILGCCQSYHEVHVVPDSDDCLALDLTDDLRMDIQPVSDFPRVDLLSEFFNEKMIKDMQLHHGRSTCRIHLEDTAKSTVDAHNRRLSDAIDPLILLALIGRKLSHRLGRLLPALYRFICLAGTQTWGILLRPVTRLFWKKS